MRAIHFLRLVFGLAAMSGWSEIALAEQIKYISKSDQALVEFLTLVESAQRSITLATFIFKPCDESTQLVMDALARRAAAGVKVKVVLDSLTQGLETKQPLVDFFYQSGIEVGFYNCSLPEIDSRLHMKFMVVDGEAYIAGGRNISDEYFGLSTGYNFIDRDVLVRGSSARQVEQSFRELWSSNLTERLRPSSTRFPGWDYVCRKDGRQRRTQIRQYVKREGARLRQLAPERSCSQVQFLSDSPDLAKAVQQTRDGHSQIKANASQFKEKRATRRMLSYLNGTKKSLDIENWAYMPIHGIYRAFANLRARQIPVRVLTNQDMDEKIDVLRQAEEYTIAYFSELDSNGSQIVRRVSSVGRAGTRHSLTPPGVPFFIHGKVAIRDRRDVVVSSFNMDPRSYNLNLESVVDIRECPEFAADVQRPFEIMRSAYEADAQDPNIPPPEEYSPLARWFASVFWEEF